MALRTDHIHDESDVRAFMLDEFALDRSENDLYFGAHLNADGADVWPSLLEEAISYQDSAWLADSLRVPRYWLTHYTQQRRTGPVVAAVPRDAPDKLADGEFGRFYIRGVCREALDTGQGVIVVRLRQSRNPRPESDSLVGQQMDAAALLADLRGNKGSATYNGVPGGPNSGLGVALF